MMARLDGAGPVRRKPKTPKPRETQTKAEQERARVLQKTSTMQAVSLAKRLKVPVTLARLPK